MTVCMLFSWHQIAVAFLPLHRDNSSLHCKSEASHSLICYPLRPYTWIVGWTHMICTQGRVEEEGTRRKDLELRLQRSQAEWEVRLESPGDQAFASLTRKLRATLLVTPPTLPQSVSDPAGVNSRICLRYTPWLISYSQQCGGRVRNER